MAGDTTSAGQVIVANVNFHRETGNSGDLIS